MLTAGLFSTKLLTSHLFSILCSGILCTLLLWSLRNFTFPYMGCHFTFLSNHFSSLPRLHSILTVSFNTFAVPSSFISFANLVVISQMSKWRVLLKALIITGPELPSPPIWEWIKENSEWTGFASSYWRLSSFQFQTQRKESSALFPKQIYNRHSK